MDFGFELAYIDLSIDEDSPQRVYTQRVLVPSRTFRPVPDSTTVPLPGSRDLPLTVYPDSADSDSADSDDDEFPFLDFIAPNMETAQPSRDWSDYSDDEETLPDMVEETPILGKRQRPEPIRSQYTLRKRRRQRGDAFIRVDRIIRRPRMESLPDDWNFMFYQ